MVLPQAAKFNADFGELADMPAEIRVGRIRVKCPQRLAVHHKRDGDAVGPTDAVEMILNVADDEIDLVEVAQVIDDLQFTLRPVLWCYISGRVREVAADAKAAPSAENAPHKMRRRCMAASSILARRFARR
jgi:hypothetical protein